MGCHHKTLSFRSSAHEQVIDITREVEACVRDSGASDGICLVYTPHATAAIAINENDDPNIGTDLLRALAKAVPQRDGWLHDRIDGNAAAHIKSAILGPSESIPIAGGKLILGRWQNVFLLELDGPRSHRSVQVTIVS